MTTVEAVAANGSGCPGATPTAVLNGDSVEVTVPGYVVSRGANTPPTDFRKACQFSLRVTGPAGSRFALAGVDTHGSMNLNTGSTGQLKVSYYFQGGSTSTLVRAFGAGTNDWTDSSTAATLAYGDGTKLLNVKTELIVSGTGSAVDTLSIAAPVVVHLTWQ